MIDDRETGGVEIQRDRFDSPARDRRTNRPAIQHAGENEIVRVLRVTGRFADSVFSWNARADCGHITSLCHPEAKPKDLLLSDGEADPSLRSG
jgi:hypothetical protein